MAANGNGTGGHVELVNLVKQFGDATAVDNISVTIQAGEFFSLLGPSGCGKTTTLRMVAGFEEPTSGSILLDGSDVARLPPNKRNVNTVFQSYALFPFLNVADNVAFGLKYKTSSKAEVSRQVGEALELVQLTGYEKRRPGQLSGGQQQRVALARALVLKPAVLLLDEPLGALDAKLRRALQVELKALQERVGITFLYVTHDQEEALTMSDRLAVMSNGRIAQLGTPRTVYEEPADAYVADFLGVSNLMEAHVERAGSDSTPCELRVGSFTLSATCGSVDATGDVKLAIRPERVQLHPADASGVNHVPATIERVVFLGSASQVILSLASGDRLQALIQNDGEPLAWTSGSAVNVVLPPDALRVLPGGGVSVAEIREETYGDQPADVMAAPILT
ncbi:MAG TPA: ABC transporter ATP-binding protein [Acidimicrobiales bacterium]|nr:ABC transporter ATP-binding protein [Acidimicrobiales bacterium]